MDKLICCIYISFRILSMKNSNILKIFRQNNNIFLASVSGLDNKWPICEINVSFAYSDY